MRLQDNIILEESDEDVEWEEDERRSDIGGRPEPEDVRGSICVQGKGRSVVFARDAVEYDPPEVEEESDE